MAERTKEIPDWELRINLIRQEYQQQKSALSPHKIDWIAIVKLQKPKEITNLGVWIKFVKIASKYLEEKKSSLDSTITFRETTLEEDQTIKVLERLHQELTELGGGDIELGRELMEKYLFD